MFYTINHYFDAYTILISTLNPNIQLVAVTNEAICWIINNYVRVNCDVTF